MQAMQSKDAPTRLSSVKETVSTALQLALHPTVQEQVRLENAAGRIVAGDVIALFALPLHDHSAVDGYALSRPGQVRQKIAGRSAAGDERGSPLQAGEAIRILTGAPVPPDVAAIVMQEHAVVDDGWVTPTFDVPAGDNIRRAGEDIARMDVLVKAGTRLDPRHIALLAAAGYQGIGAYRPVRVALMSTGNELREAGVGMGPGSNFDSNRPMLNALLASPATQVTDLGILPDDPARIADAMLQAAASHDLLISVGGVSVGEEDHVRDAVAVAGGHIDTWSMAIKPGKPIALGSIGNCTYLGLPGNPLACFTDFLLVGRPLIAALSGVAGVGPIMPFAAEAGFSWERRTGRDEFFPAAIEGYSEIGLPILHKTGRAGSARMRPLIDAQGLGMVEADRSSLKPGDRVAFYPFSTSMML
jgi:molybdopterin molybdotransferase